MRRGSGSYLGKRGGGSGDGSGDGSRDPNRFQGLQPESSEDRRKKQTNKIVLDIEKMRGTILREIEQNQVLVISGETGCGKSTQVPQYILEDKQQKGQECRILCTQPRRIACMSIAKRVAEEMGQEVGEMVGYHISMDARLDIKNSKIIFVTNGILLNYLTHNPSILTSYTHIIIDEVHERDIDSDFILILFKLFLDKFPELKLILMSATINAELFARYFSKYQIEEVAKIDAATFKWPQELKSQKAETKAEKFEKNPNCWDNMDYGDLEIKDTWRKDAVPKQKQEELAEQLRLQREEEARVLANVPMATILEINSKRKYQIKEFYLNDLNNFHTFKTDALSRLHEFNFNKRRAVFILEVAMAAIDLIEHLHLNEKHIKFPNKKIENGGILVFLPGLNEITYFIQLMSERIKREVVEELEVIPLHSTIAQIYENDIFTLNKHKRKIIVSTNIAESSLTIPDIIFVIDFCLSKEFRFDPKVQSQRLDLTWASRASSKQRTGRTGRVSDGISFRMVSREFHDKVMDAFNEAEMLRSPLDKVILKICVLHEEIQKKNDPVNSSVNGAVIHEHNSKMNEVFLGIANNIFSSPAVVLHIAIERPGWDQIEYAMHFLAKSGAFLMEDKKKFTGKITFLGRVYSDLPCNLQVVKLLLYGHIFDCFDDVVTISVMMMHPKSIWLPRTNKSSKLNYLDFYRRIDRFSDGQYSDHILYLNLFKDWYEHFGEGCDLSRRGRKLRGTHYSRIERNFTQKTWYTIHNVRGNFMAEILTSIQDLRKRLSKFISFRDNPVARPKQTDSEKLEWYLKLKVCVAASSSGNYALGISRPGSKEKGEMFNMQSDYKLDPNRCVVIHDIGIYRMLASYSRTLIDPSDKEISEKYEPIPDEVKINLWKNEVYRNVGSKYGEIEKISLCPRVGYVQFKPHIADLAIRLFLFEKNFAKGTMGTLSAYSMEEGMKSVQVETAPKNITTSSSRNFSSTITSASNPQAALLNELKTDVVTMVENLSDVTYCFKPLFENMFTNVSLMLESLSIASMITRARPDFRAPQDRDVADVKDKIFVVYSEEIQANSKSFLAKTSSLMPSIPLFLELMVMTFSNTVYLECSEKYERITHIKIDSSEIPVSYWINQHVITTVNKFRSEIKKYFEVQENEKKAPKYLWGELLQLLNHGTKEPFYHMDNWYDYFTNNHYKPVPELLRQDQDDDFGAQLNQPTSNNPNHMTSKAVEEMEEADPEKFIQWKADTVDKGNTYEGGFMNNLKFHCDLSNSRRHIEQMKSYIKWKKSIVQEVEEVQYKLDCRKSFIICPNKDCKREIVDIGSINGSLEQECFRVIRSEGRPSIKLELAPPNLDSKTAELSHDFAAFGVKIEGYYFCHSGHFIGFKVAGQESNVCLHRDSDVIIKYQDLEVVSYRNHEIDIDEVFKMDRVSEIKKNAHLDNFTCVMCDANKKFRSHQEIRYHLNEDKMHRYKNDVFRENL